MIDRIARYMESVEQYPVRSQVTPGDIIARLPEHPPAQGQPWDAITADIDPIIMPGITHWQSPNFFAYFSANTSSPSILGELLSAGLGVQGMLWATSPACTELETRILDWLIEMLDLSDHFKSTTDGGGVIQDTASSATLVAMLIARERATHWKSNRIGIDRTFTAYTSTQAHSSVEKAAMVAGIGRDNIRFIDVDERFAMKPDALSQAIKHDRLADRTPFFICATLGTTSSHAMDPLRPIGEIAQREGLFLHVDAAEAGSALICPEFRHLAAGLEYADSFCFNPHKHMLTNFDCDVHFVRDRAALIRTLSVMPEYLKNEQTLKGSVFDYRDWHIPLGRRFRALKLWFVIRHYGVEGLQTYIREHMRLAQQFESWVNDDGRFELCAPRPLNLICFRLKASNEANEQLMDCLNASGDLFLTHTKLHDRFVLRMAIGATATQERHVTRAWQRITDEADRLEHRHRPTE
ncbi:MAG: aspartate aminotransferase family protein [Phycisphaerales bacterium]|nr:aspartate aminotransferase family protein [Phycisphaerales bacterium]